MVALIDPGKSGATRAPAQRAAEYPLADMRLVVFEVEGVCQVAFLADGWEGRARRVLSNLFCDKRTAAQLRTVADDLDRRGLGNG